MPNDELDESGNFVKFLPLSQRQVEPIRTLPWRLCPDAGRWRSYGPERTVELEVLGFLEALVVLVKPASIVETGTYTGLTALWLARGCQRNGFGHVYSYEVYSKIAEGARRFLAEEGFAQWVTVRDEDARTAAWQDGLIDLLFCDGGDDRWKEIEHFAPRLSSRGIVVAHDGADSTYGWSRLREDFHQVLLPTPVGLYIMQRKGP